MILSFSGQPSEFIVFSIGFAFLTAIVFLTAFLIVWPIRRNASMITALVAASLFTGLFVIFSPVHSKKMINFVLIQSEKQFHGIGGSSREFVFDSFGQQAIAGVLQNPDNIARTIVFGSFVFAIAAVICGRLLGRSDRKSEKAEISGNASRTA